MKVRNRDLTPGCAPFYFLCSLMTMLMKRVLLVLLLLATLGNTMAESPKSHGSKDDVIVAVVNYDFGRFPKQQKKSVMVEVYNNGQKPLVIENVSASCGCTKVKWTKKPIKPRQSGYILVTFDGRFLSNGRFHKEVNITINTPVRYHRFWVNGEVY